MRTNDSVPVHRGDRLWSQSCVVGDLFEDFTAECSALAVSDRWSAEWRIAGTEVVCSLPHLGTVPLSRAGPVRQFSWRPRQRHRPGLQYMISTGRHHGFESLEEQRFLLALDFAGRIRDVLPQPFRLRFVVSGRSREHTPDFLVLLRDGCWLIDVRPRRLIKPEDIESFAAAREAAFAAGWRYDVVAGWRENVITGLEAISAQRRPLDDPYGIQRQLWDAADEPVPFGELVESVELPVMARAHALHLLWSRHLGVDLAGPLRDASLVCRSGRRP
ncbi:TnsA-like heteromeric transposase endonuclease subunit [Streptomyces sp. NPDC002521]